MRYGLVLLLLLLLPLACSRKQEPTKQEPVELYQVVSHQVSTGEWVIVTNREINGYQSRVRITAVCDSYQWDEHEAVKGPDSCDLVVGETLVPNRLPTNRRDFLDIGQSGDKFFVTRGDGPDRVHQQFSVRAAQVIQQ